MNINNNQDEREKINNLIRLSDSIFALAMALTILGFDLPESAISMSDRQINSFLMTQLKPLGLYVSTFILIAFYWVDNSQQFSYYKKTDAVHLWLYILYLMCLFIIPYSNALIIYFPENLLVQIEYSLNIFLIGLFSFVNWTYATHKHRLVEPNLEIKTITENKIKSLIEPSIALITILVALFNRSLWELTWLLLPIVYVLVEKFRKNSIHIKEEEI
ncbi:MAG: TMEM175 family protein [Pleurocapsa sp.]